MSSLSLARISHHPSGVAITGKKNGLAGQHGELVRLLSQGRAVSPSGFLS